MKTIIDTEVTKVTKVKFLIEKDNGNTVFAYFPEEIHNTVINPMNKKAVNIMTSYAHIGQHSPCLPAYADECKEATKEQYQDLKAELESIGYNLRILNRK